MPNLSFSIPYAGAHPAGPSSWMTVAPLESSFQSSVISSTDAPRTDTKNDPSPGRTPAECQNATVVVDVVNESSTSWSMSKPMPGTVGTVTWPSTIWIGSVTMSCA